MYIFHHRARVLQKPGLGFLSWRLVKIFTECGHDTQDFGSHTNITPGISVSTIRDFGNMCYTSHSGHRTSGPHVHVLSSVACVTKTWLGFFVMASGKNFLRNVFPHTNITPGISVSPIRDFGNMCVTLLTWVIGPSVLMYMFHHRSRVLQKPGLGFLSWRLVKFFTECVPPYKHNTRDFRQPHPGFW
jgi:hypothetical protein